MSIWKSHSSGNWSIWFCNLWGQFLSDHTLLYIFEKLWRFRFFWWLFCSISMCIRIFMNISRLSKFQTFILWHQSDIRNFWGRYYLIRLSDYPFLHLYGKPWWLRFFSWKCCSISTCIGRDMCDWNLPKFQTFISRQQSYSAMSEVNSNPITMFYIFLEIYFDCASFGGLAKFHFVLA